LKQIIALLKGSNRKVTPLIILFKGKGKDMGKLVNLLRWKKPLLLKDDDGKVIKDDKGKEVKVWLRIIGDEAQQEAFKMARIKSAEKRIALRNMNSSDYKDQVLPIAQADKETCIELIKISRGSNFTGEALANVERPELPKMEEVAVDADAPTLEEQEKLDSLVVTIEKEYQAAIDTYVQTRGTELDKELEEIPLDSLRVQAMFETSNALALSVFLGEVQNEKAWRSVFMDEACTIPAYDDIEEFREQHSVIKKQIIEAYAALEISPDDVKN
jgi:hypothetical protein